MVRFSGWFGWPNGNEASRSLAGLKGKPDDVSTSDPGDATGKMPSENICYIQDYVRGSIQRGAYVDFQQLRKLIGPSWETIDFRLGQFLDWSVCWQKYRSMVLEVQPKREAELQQYGNSIEGLFLLLRPQVHSFIVELDQAERKRLGGLMEGPKTPPSGEFSDGSLLPGEAESRTLSVQVRRRAVSLGRQALGASALHRFTSLTVWRAIRKLFKLVTFSAFA